MSDFKPVDRHPDHAAIEHAALEKWERERTFETLRNRNRGNEAYSFIDGPINANNPMGVHHARGRSYKDIFQRYHAMLGKDQRYQNGFDCQGLWVEVEVEKALGLNSKPEIEEYGLDRFARACRDRVAEYSAVQTEQSKRLGQWMDWDNSYFTMTDANVSYIWRFLRECHDRGWLTIGHRSMPWCPRCGTSLSQHELIDAYAEVTHPSLYVRFPLRDKPGEHLVIWTTTPWTLPANVAAAVNPDAAYARVRTTDGIAYIAKDLLASVPISGDVLDTVPGRDLVGLAYHGPFDHLPAQEGVEHRVIAWDDVSMEDGTGIVHIAPGCGTEDFELSKRDGLPVLIPIDEGGVIVDGFGPFVGLAAPDARGPVIEDLRARGILAHAGEITHRYPTCWRCKTELLWRVVDEWFITSNEIRQPMIEAARTVNWTPPQYGKRMEDWLRNMGDWCISRKRYWGLPLPFYFCPDKHLTVISGMAELYESAISGLEGLEELHRPWIDGVTVACETCGQEATRVKDVGDCWLDAGIVPFSTMGWQNPEEIPGGYARGAGEGLTTADLPSHEAWERWFPAEWVSEMREQIRLWFYSMLFMSVTLDGRSPYRNVLVYERVNAEDGRPMHKSWGNMIEANQAMETMGADIMRWMYAATSPAADVNFGFGPADEVKRKLLTLWNTYKFFVGYARIDGYTPRASVLRDGPAPSTDLDRWVLAACQRTIETCRTSYEAYDAQNVLRTVENFIEDLSNWYVRLSRGRFWRSGDEADTRAAHDTLWYCLVQSIRLLAPVMPFMAEHIWGNLALGDGFESSVHLAGFPEVIPALRDTDVLRDMDAVREVVALGRTARAEAKIGKRQPLRKVIAATGDAAKRAAIERHAALVREELAVKEIEFAGSQADFAQVEVVANFKVCGPKYGARAKEIDTALRSGSFTRDGAAIRVADLTLDAGDYEERTRAKEGFAVAESGGVALALDTHLTPDLELEGRANDLIRAIQDLRKQADLEMTDRITVTYPFAEADVFAVHGDHIREETLTTDATPADSLTIERVAS
jgi:isoleucyl-tRNA synthetase